MNMKIWISITFCLAIIAFSSAHNIFQDATEVEEQEEIESESPEPPSQPVQPQAQPPKKKLEEPTKPKTKRIELKGPDPCLARPCKKGEECILKEDNPNIHECRCITSCTNMEYSDPICTGTNKTYNTECDFYRMQCICNKGSTNCTDNDVKNTFLAYYAGCQAYSCNDQFDYVDYPARLGLWLQMVFFEKARMTEHDDIDNLDILLPMDRRNRDIVNSMYQLLPGENGSANATFVTWWFCNLDKDNNNFLDKPEYAMLVRALMPSDQCIITFIGQCDSSGDGKVGFDEWHKCFQIQKEFRLATCEDLYKVSRSFF